MHALNIYIRNLMLLCLPNQVNNWPIIPFNWSIVGDFILIGIILAAGCGRFAISTGKKALNFFDDVFIFRIVCLLSETLVLAFASGH